MSPPGITYGLSGYVKKRTPRQVTDDAIAALRERIIILENEVMSLHSIVHSQSVIAGLPVRRKLSQGQEKL